MATARKLAAAPPVLDPGLPYVPYVRVSDVNGREGESYTSPTDQGKSIIGTAQRLDVPLIADPAEFKDEDKSGATFARPAWERALALIESGQAAGIIAFNLAGSAVARPARCWRWWRTWRCSEARCTTSTAA